MKRYLGIVLLSVLPFLLLAVLAGQAVKAGDSALGSRKYSDFRTPKFCGTSCHTDIFQQWGQAMMSQAYTHP